MTALQFAPAGPKPLPRLVCPSQVGIGDIVRFGDEPLPVIITDSALEGEPPVMHRAFWWVSQVRWSSGKPVTEGKGIHDIGEKIWLIARGETVHADQICDGDVLLLEGHASVYGIVTSTPHLVRPGVLDIPWVAGRLPSGMPSVFGSLQRDPSQTVRRAARGVAL